MSIRRKVSEKYIVARIYYYHVLLSLIIIDIVSFLTKILK